MDIATLGGMVGGTVWNVFFFIIALSVIVFVHEYGHYIVGRWTGIHSEVFSLGFGPVLWSRRDKRGTQWQVAAIPFGGYVKFMGDADASSVMASDTAGLTPTERRHTMQGAPLWARSLTVAAGPVANFILSFVILVGMLLVMGVPRDEPVVESVRAYPFDGPSLQPGDVILAIEGRQTPDGESFGAAIKDLPVKRVMNYTVRRGDQVLEVGGPRLDAPIVSSVIIRSAAIDAGLREGDVILTMDGQEIGTFEQLRGIVQGSEGRALPMTIWRDGETLDLTLTPRVRTVPDDVSGAPVDKYQIGITSSLAFTFGNRSVGPWEAVTLGAGQIGAIFSGTLTGLWQIATGQISNCNLSGPIGMAESIGDAARIGVETLILLMAMMSLGVGVLNLLPIPVLDGGHLVFHAYEAVVRRPPPERALRVMMTVGLTVVISVMLFALSRDFICV
jgi:regulator of sigma E protease